MTLTDTNQVLPAGVSQAEVPQKPTELQEIRFIINEKVLEALRIEDLSINQMFILLAMDAGNIPLLDKYDDNNSNRRVLIEDYQYLLIHGYFSESGAESKIMYDITDKGREFVSLIKHYFEFKDEEETETDAKLRLLAEQYLEIFPKIKLPSGKYARAAIPEIAKKLKVFKTKNKPVFKKFYGFELTNEDIFEAAKLYVKRYERTNYQFMVTSSYFIQKNEKSPLADEIIAMKQGLSKIVNKFEKQI